MPDYIKTISTEQWNLLIDLVKKINSQLGLDHVLSEIMNSAKVIMHSEASSLFLLSDDGKKLTLTIPTGPATAEISGKSIDSDKGISGWSVQNQSSVIVNDVQADPRFDGEMSVQSTFRTRNLICVPLITNEGECIGALQAINRLGDKDFDADDIPLFQSLANHAAIALENAKLQQERIEKEILEKELDLARDIQSGFWPEEIPEIRNYEVAGFSRAAKSVGGDYYDFIEIPGTDKWGFTVADVSGKGVPASLLMATMRASLRSHIADNCSVEECIDKVNKLIFEDSPIDKFITAFYGELNTREHSFKYVNAGHNDPYIISRESGELKELKAGGIMLGILYPNSFEWEVKQIEVGQKIVIYSDGIPEACNANGDFYSDERFQQWLIDNRDLKPAEMMEKLINTIDTFCEGETQSDDITCIILERVK